MRDLRNLKKEVIASWNIFLERDAPTDKLIDIMSWLFGEVLRLINEFEQEELLFLDAVELRDWSTADMINKSDSGIIEKVPNVMPVDNNDKNNLMSTFNELLKQYNYYATPCTILFYGKGYVYKALSDKILYENLIWIEACFVMDNVYVKIYTNSDSWLPCSIEGERQQGIHELNAPRLSRALMQIADLEQIELSVTDSFYTKYSYNNKFTLDNI